MEHFLNREQLTRMRGEVLREGGRFKARLCLYRKAAGEPVVVKDCACMHPLARWFMGAPAQRREVKIYRRLAGVKGIPDFMGVVDRFAFAVEFVGPCITI